MRVGSGDSRQTIAKTQRRLIGLDVCIAANLRFPNFIYLILVCSCVEETRLSLLALSSERQSEAWTLVVP